MIAHVWISHSVQHFVKVRCGMIPADFLELVRFQRNAWHEKALVSGPVMWRHGEYSEKAQHMVDAARRKVAGHDLEPLLPPGVLGPFHFLPVVQREVPVLSCSPISYRRTSRRQFHVKVLGGCKRVCPVPLNANGQISLEHDSCIPCGLRYFVQLMIQKVLREIDESDFLSILGMIDGCQFLDIRRFHLPFAIVPFLRFFQYHFPQRISG
mmetsp:Transcript_5840/g.10499  ORF Transcript_5840/g.10499 Transcript_5840/m.10499 type:complete len:210 (-) Transcript_5840:232-861(-)